MILFLQGCVQPESPVLRSIGTVDFELLSLNVVRLKSEALLYNPNKTSLMLKESAIDIELDGKKIGSVNRKYDLKIKRESEFTVPIEVDVKLSDLNLNTIGAALGLLGGKGKEIRFFGKIKVRAYGVPFTIPVDYMEHVKISF
jgi:LEA14-like dessication related protein